LNEALNPKRTNIPKMHHSMKDAEEEDEPSRHFMEVNMLVNGHVSRSSARSKKGQTLTQHYHHDKSTVEI